MDGVSIAASIVGIATAGVQVSIKLVTLATQISTASDRVSSIGNDISLTSSVLHQLGELMTQRTTDDRVCILNQHGLETTRISAAMCERIFQEVEKEIARASEQLRRFKPSRGSMRGGKIELSTYERAKWPFLQPTIDIMRADLRDAKSTLMLMLQVASLALSKRMADASMSTSEHQDFVRAIVALELQRREEGIGKPQPSASLAQAGSEYTAELNDPAKDSSNGHAKSLLDPIVSSRTGGSRGLENPLTTSPYLKLPRTDGNTNNMLLSDKGSETQSNHNAEIELFLLKPIVKDLFDRIELRWSIQNTNMRPLAIREHMAKNEKDDLPSVVEVLQQLHAYEQSMIDSLLFQGFGASVAYLRRTKTDIQLRGMHFKAVPGLQLVIQRRIPQPTPQNLVAIERARWRKRSVRVPGFTFLRRRRKMMEAIETTEESDSLNLHELESLSERMRSQSPPQAHGPDDEKSTTGYTFPSTVFERSGANSLAAASIAPSTASLAAIRRRPLAELAAPDLESAIEPPPFLPWKGDEAEGSRANHPVFTPRTLSGRGHFDNFDSLSRSYLSPSPPGKQPHIIEQQERNGEDEEAEALVTGLLGRYTTLFES